MDIDSAVVHEVYELLAKSKEGRGSKELDPRKFDPKERGRYDASDRKELEARKQKDAMVQMSREETEKIVKQRRGRIILGKGAGCQNKQEG